MKHDWKNAAAYVEYNEKYSRVFKCDANIYLAHAITHLVADWFFWYRTQFGNNLYGKLYVCACTNLTHEFYGPRPHISRFSRWRRNAKKPFLIKRTGTEFRNGTANSEPQTNIN